MFVPRVVFLHPLTIAGRNICLVIQIQKIGFYLARKVLGVNSTVVDLVENVLVEEPPTGKDDYGVKIPRVIGIQLFRPLYRANPAVNLPVGLP